MLILLRVLQILGGLLLSFLVLHTLIRIIRHFHPFPIPEFAANIIDNPMRRRLQPPDETALRHGVRPGIRMLDIGPGNGTYTLAAGKEAGADGLVIAIDIEPKMIARLYQRINQENTIIVPGCVADAYQLPFGDRAFDLVTLITVIGEIPSPERAIIEFARILSTQGRLVFSELLFDPDYPRAGRLIRLAENAGFRLDRKLGNFFYYTLIFEKKLEEILT